MQQQAQEQYKENQRKMQEIIERFLQQQLPFRLRDQRPAYAKHLQISTILILTVRQYGDVSLKQQSPC